MREELGMSSVPSLLEKRWLPNEEKVCSPSSFHLIIYNIIVHFGATLLHHNAPLTRAVVVRRKVATIIITSRL